MFRLELKELRLQKPAGINSYPIQSTLMSSVLELGFFYYFRVLCISCILLIIFVYVFSCIYWLLIFFRVLIVYFQNIVYSCITINFTISYVKIAHIYYIPCTCNYSIYFSLFQWICIYLCCLFQIFKCEYRYSIICGPWPKLFNEGGRGKTRSWKFC